MTVHNSEGLGLEPPIRARGGDYQLRLKGKALRLHGLLGHWDAAATAGWAEKLIGWEEEERGAPQLGTPAADGPRLLASRHDPPYPAQNSKAPRIIGISRTDSKNCKSAAAVVGTIHAAADTTNLISAPQPPAITEACQRR